MAAATTSHRSRAGSSVSDARLAEAAESLTRRRMVRLRTLLEAELPADSQTAANRRLERRLERDLRRYFQRLEDAMPMRKIAALYNRLGSEE